MNMFIAFKASLFFLALSFMGNSFSSSVRTIKFASTGWCPYACQSEENNGLAAKKIKEALKKMNIEMTIDFFPWRRALELVETGQYDGLLTAVKAEAPKLFFTSTPTMHYQNCFYATKEVKWNYKTKASLENIPKLGVVSGYGYGEPLDKYIKESKNVIAITGGGSLKRLIKMLEHDRVDLVVEDKNVVKLLPQEKRFFEKGCLSMNPFYIAFKDDEFFKTKVIPFLNKNL